MQCRIMSNSARPWKEEKEPSAGHGSVSSAEDQGVLRETDYTGDSGRQRQQREATRARRAVREKKWSREITAGRGKKQRRWPRTQASMLRRGRGQGECHLLVRDSGMMNNVSAKSNGWSCAARLVGASPLPLEQEKKIGSRRCLHESPIVESRSSPPASWHSPWQHCPPPPPPRGAAPCFTSSSPCMMVAETRRKRSTDHGKWDKHLDPPPFPTTIVEPSQTTP